ncbi:hypothetical protein SEA_FIDGETORCA_54 [Streptomyces phage FidgetOrca]|uniref:Uncharacterized protein n=5 Tax=Rimavirus TaxID=2560214 RepID=A0A8F3E4T9_9CAUD|nr:hypothetical protein SEA_CHERRYBLOSSOM_54 [Streptomyces phage CherryBlossom]QEQ94666.1 hypothetical protein SEA_SOSHI_53 [Streptomyces phage Soshi]QGJ96753.1 hypothetical protein SEA_FIDGETORCA_54 [Streptomyces phage FidgetOrca]QNN99529.1 hypothetical protein SEA_TIEDYE_53 [Streptomyces phage TieDye]QWY81453.1 hypothetical protein PET_TAIDAONE_54 [Streptomyces phage TaidaOne]
MKSRASRHRRVFDRTNPNWNSKDRWMNAVFVQDAQEKANHILRTRGHVSLNEVLTLLGFEKDRWGEMIGWIRGSEEGDGYIDFGVWAHGFAEGRDWTRGKVDFKALYFNVDRSDDPLTYRIRKLKEEGKLQWECDSPPVSWSERCSVAPLCE